MTGSGSHKYVISVGSNIECAREMVERGLKFLSDVLSAVKISEIYSTKSVSRDDDSDYYNAVISGCSVLSADQLSELLKGWERSVGRMPGSKAVAGDMDMVIVDGTIVRRRDYDREYFQIGFSQIAETEGSTGGCED